MGKDRIQDPFCKYLFIDHIINSDDSSTMV